MEALIQDLRFAARSLSRRPAFTVAAALTLALGIGANTAIFGLVDAVLLRPPFGVAEPDRLVALYTSDFSGPAYGTSSYPDYEDLRENAAFSGLAAWTGANVAVGEPGSAASASGLAVSADYFEVLGARPHAGRFFRPEEEAAPGDLVVVSHGYWQRELGGDPSAIGETLRVNGQRLQIVGVAEAGFVGYSRAAEPDLWLPTQTALRIGAMFGSIDTRGNRGHNLVARLAPGITAEQAQSAMRLAAAQLHSLEPQLWSDVRGEVRRLTVVPERLDRVPPGTRGAILGVTGVLIGAAALVLLLCCANVAGLLIARAGGRAREIGVRLSLGARRGRLVRQLLTESLVLALLGGGTGVLLAFWATDLIGGLGDLQNALGVPLDIHVDVRLLGFAAVVSVATAALFGLMPALRASRLDLASTMRVEATGAAAGGPKSVVRGLLVGAQIAVSVVLLVGAMLLVRTLQSAYAADPGFETDNILLVGTTTLPGVQASADPATQLLQVRERLAALPGVEAAGWGWFAPLQGGAPRRGLTVQDYQPGDGEDMGIYVDHVGPGFFETLNIPIIDGRALDETDRVGAAPVVVVNESFARRYWPGRDPIGMHISQMGSDYAVVGVARDVRFLSATADPAPMVYIPALQVPRGSTFYLRTQANPEAVLPSLRSAIAEVAPGLEITRVRTMQEQRGTTLGGQRLAGGAVGLFAGLALLLAMIGLYGVVSFAVSRRAREIGVRVALGARPGEVVGLLLRQALPVVGAGALVGFIGALAAARSLGGLLIGVQATDPVSYGSAAAMLAVVALFATWWPARRATRVSPMIALRTD